MNHDHPDHDLNDDPNDQENTPSQEARPLIIEDVAIDDFELGIRIDEPLDLPASPPPNAEETPVFSDGDAAPSAPTGLSPADAFPSTPPNEAIAPPAPLEAIALRLEELVQAFDAKLKYDEHKNKIIDDLHLSLQQHRDGLLKKYLHRIVMDVIKIVDDMRKLAAHYSHLPHSEETSGKLLKYIENIASDLEDLFSWEGVTPFTCDGDAVDPSRQRILGKIGTDDPEKDKTIAERLRPGYEWDGKIIRPEMISVYVYQPNSPSGE